MVIGRWLFSVGAVACTLGGCSSEGARPPSQASEETSEQDPGDSSTPHDAGSPAATGDEASDASNVGTGSTQLELDTTASSLASDSTAASAIVTSTSIGQDASVILDPEFEALSVDELCERIGYLEGESVDVDLTTELIPSEWSAVVATSIDAGTNAVNDAMVCEQRFAAYVVPCNGSVLVVTAPTFAFGQGPSIGGEVVGFGCWDSACDTGCLPDSIDGAGKVRVRVTAPVNPRYDEERSVTVGDIRVSGVDVEGVAQLEVLERL